MASNSTRRPRLRTVTLGCKVNQYETQLLREGLLRIGYVDAQEDEPADFCVVNTCTVTSEGDAKSRQVIRRLARRNPDARILVMGCYATRAPEEVAALPGVAEVVRDKRELPDLLGRWGAIEVRDGVDSFGSRHRAYVKVQDGCILRCSFCIIPKVRPHLESRRPEAILSEIGRLVAAGYREVVLTGIHLGHYGVDLSRGLPKASWFRLADLVRRVAELPGDFRVRLSSIEATEVTRELISVLADHSERVVPHLHISMQSGSDTVLRRMKRRWGARRFIDRCLLVRETLDRPALTTDVLVGFPGESEEEFSATLAAADDVGFSKMHIFPFSPRRGTPAAEMPDQVPAEVKAERCRNLAELETRLRSRYFESLRGQPLEVLVEAPIADRPGRVEGTACRYAPVDIDAGLGRPGDLVRVVAGRALEGRILGSAV